MSTPKTHDWFSIKNVAGEGPAEILIYNEIGKDWFTNDGTGAEEFINAASEVDPKRQLSVGINSPGGNVWDGLAIYHWLIRRGNVTTRNDGLAASIAAVIMMAGTRAVMPKNARFMIHMAESGVVGRASDMRKQAEVVDGVDDSIANILAARSRQSRGEVLKMMEATTWMNGDKAKTLGFVDEVTDSAPMRNCFDLSRFKNAPIVEPEPTNLAVQPNADGSAASISVAAVAVADGELTAPTQNQTKENNSMPEATPTPAVANPPADFTPVIAAINALGEKITTANSLPGTAPLTCAHRVENLGNPLVERFNNTFDVVEKAKLAKNLYNEVRKQLMIANSCGDVILTPDNRFDLNDTKIRNANTVDAALANTILSSDAVTTMRTYFAPWTGFTRTVQMSPVSKRQTLEVPLVSSAGSMQTNATNYETGDTTLAPIAITTAEYSKSFHVTRPQTNLGLQLSAHAPTHAKILGEGISALFTALMTNANYGADVVIGAAADFSATDLPAILAYGKNYTKTTLVIDGGHLAYLLPTSRESFVFGEPGAYGFDGGIYKNNLWTSGATDICGLVCGADAIVSAWGQADGLPAGEAISQSNIDIMGFPVSVTVWFSRATREVWGSYQLIGGVAAGDKTQAEVLTTQ